MDNEEKTDKTIQDLYTHFMAREKIMDKIKQIKTNYFIIGLLLGVLIVGVFL